ncbi:MAG: archaetidylserine decarboxylase [Woeseiaceae bacterium]|jgi:phosphatidylserine decarboxylase
MMTRLFVYLQYLLPRYWITAVIYQLARIRQPAIKDFLITGFMRLYAIDTADVKREIPQGFATFNEFFVRELRDGARPVDTLQDTLVSPVDGTVSQAGTLLSDRILQAKGHDYSLDELLAADLDTAQAFADGSFATIYLAPYNYHRVHAPIAGKLVAAHYVPGDLFSVNTATAATIPGLFRRNERLILHFRAACGPVAVILVGALNVGSITTPWSGEIRPRKSGIVENLALDGASRDVGKGDLLGWFNMGSTVIVLLPRGACTWRDGLRAGAGLRMGETIGTVAGTGK